MEKIKTTLEIVPESCYIQKMTDEEYFSLKDYVSNSKLSLINPDEDGSFEKFEEGFIEEFSESYELGTVIHSMVLQPDSYKISNLTKPNGKLGIFAEKVYKFRKEGLTIEEAIKNASIESNYYSGKLQGKRLETAIRTSLPFYLSRCKEEEELTKTTLYLSNSHKDKYISCMLNISSNIEFKNTLFPQGILSSPEVYNEYAIFCTFKVTVGEYSTFIKFKGKLDNFTIDHEEQKVVLNDLKTTSKPLKYFMGNSVKVSKEDEETTTWYDGSFQKYHYYRQMAIYMMLLQYYCNTINLNTYSFKSNMIVVETIPEFNCQVFPVKNTYIKKGLEEFKNLMIRIAKWTEYKENK